MDKAIASPTEPLDPVADFHTANVPYNPPNGTVLAYTDTKIQSYPYAPSPHTNPFSAIASQINKEFARPSKDPYNVILFPFVATTDLLTYIEPEFTSIMEYYLGPTIANPARKIEMCTVLIFRAKGLAPGTPISFVTMARGVRLHIPPGGATPGRFLLVDRIEHERAQKKLSSQDKSPADLAQQT